MKFHWFERNFEEIERIRMSIQEVEDSGYESVLLAVHSRRTDKFIIASLLAQEFKQIKFMIAARPYLISPQHLFMINESFHEIAEGRLMINLVNGWIEPDENFEGIIGSQDLLSDHSARKFYMEEFLDKYYNIEEKSKRPTILISGASQKMKDLARLYTKVCATGLDNFIRSPESYHDLDRIFVYVQGILVDDNELVIEKPNHFVGNKKDFIDLFNRLKSLGATDILINSRTNSHKMHALIKEITDANL